MISKLSSWTLIWMRITKPNLMMARKIKPEVVDSKLASRLRQSNMFQPFNPNINNQNLQFLSSQKRANPKNKNGRTYQQKNQEVDSLDKTHQSQQDHRKRQKRQINEIRKAKRIKKDFHQENKNIIQLQKPKYQSQKNIPAKSNKKSTPLDSALNSLGKILDPIDPKQLRNQNIQQTSIAETQQIQNAIADIKKLKLKDFSIVVHRLLVNSSEHVSTLQKFLWKQIQQNFLKRFEITSDQNKIRSYSKIIYSLSKSKANRNVSSSTVSTSISTNLQSLQIKFALLLPSCTHQSYATILTSLSRMGPLSEQFSYIAQRLYYSKYQQFNARERVQINYALTRNGRQVDTNLYKYIDGMNLKQIVTMLRCYQNCNQLYDVEIQNSSHKNLLSFAQKHIIARKKQMNVIDIGEICHLYFEAMINQYRISSDLEKVITQMYSNLKKNINQVAFQKIWKNLPAVVNRGYLQVQFVQQIMKTLKIMRKKDLFPERIWKPLCQSFAQFQNLQLRTRLQQIK